MPDPTPPRMGEEEATVSEYGTHCPKCNDTEVVVSTFGRNKGAEYECECVKKGCDEALEKIEDFVKALRSAARRITP